MQYQFEKTSVPDSWSVLVASRRNHRSERWVSWTRKVSPAQGFSSANCALTRATARAFVLERTSSPRQKLDERRPLTERMTTTGHTERERGTRPLSDGTIRQDLLDCSNRSHFATPPPLRFKWNEEERSVTPTIG